MGLPGNRGPVAGRSMCSAGRNVAGRRVLGDMVTGDVTGYDGVLDHCEGGGFYFGKTRATAE